jgi:hypothetical protein
MEDGWGLSVFLATRLYKLNISSLDYFSVYLDVFPSPRSKGSTFFWNANVKRQIYTESKKKKTIICK